MATPFNVASRALADIDAARLSIQQARQIIDASHKAIDASHTAIAEVDALLEWCLIRERGA